MFIRFAAPLAGVLLLSSVVSTIAAPVGLTFVSAAGADAGDCSNPSAPCRTLSYAIGQTTDRGEVKTLTPGDYGPIAITKTIKITGVPGALIVRNSPGNAVTISGGAVTITGMTINGMGVGTNGVRINAAAIVVIRNCTIKNHVQAGIRFAATSAVRYVIEESYISGNGSGIELGATVAGSLAGVIHRTSIDGNGGNSSGVVVGARASARISSSLIANHDGYGVYVSAGAGAALHLSASTVTKNGTGFARKSGASIAETAGDNFIRGNTVDIETGTGFVAPTNSGTL